MISVDRRQETGHDVILTKNQSRIVDVRTAETIRLSKSKGIVRNRPVALYPDGPGKGRGVFGFCTVKASGSGDVLVGPMFEAQRWKERGNERELLASHEDEDEGEKEMECEDTAQETERAKTVSDLGQPSRREREEHEATHAQYRSWRIACARGAFSRCFCT